MMLVSIAPGFLFEPCRVRVYACSKGSKLRTRMADVKFDQVPDKFDVQDLQRRPLAFIAGTEVA